jgi:CubicO group peptidase (beta-lactamase class C family)
MQLYEQGKLDLNRDVNNYLELFKLKENYPEPVTAYNLLTHTAGFRGWAIGIYTRNESERIPLGEFLARNMPPCSLPPGGVISYSNHGFYLAGHLVEAISGLSFDEYVRENILRPLGMENSGFVTLDRLEPNMAKGYSYSNGNYRVVPTEYPIPRPSPAGSLLASAEDIASFMIAHLQGGAYKDQRILKESTCCEMQEQQFVNDPRLPGIGYGFYEYKGYNQRALMHDGDVSGFSSRLFLLPEHALGFFVCNNTGNSILRMELTDHLMSRYFTRPESPRLKETAKDNKSFDKRLAGSYRSTRIGLDSFDKLSYTGAVWDVTEETVKSWVEVEPGLFHIPSTSLRIAFGEDERSHIKYLYMDAQQMPISYEKLAWHENYLRFPMIWFSFFAVCFLWIGAARPTVTRIRARRKLSVEKSRQVKLTKSLAVIISDVYLVFILGFTPAFMMNEEQIGFGVPWMIKALLVLPILNLVLTAVFIILFIKSWKDKYWDFKKHLYYVLIILLFIGVVFYLNYWNLLGFQY